MSQCVIIRYQYIFAEPYVQEQIVVSSQAMVEQSCSHPIMESSGAEPQGRVMEEMDMMPTMDFGDGVDIVQYVDGPTTDNLQYEELGGPNAYFNVQVL